MTSCGGTEAAQGNCPGDSPHRVIRRQQVLFGPGRGDHPGTDHVGADPVRGALGRELARHRDHAALRCRVGDALIGHRAGDTCGRADVEDRSAARLQVRPGVLAGEEDRVELGREREAPVGKGLLLNRAEAHRARVVVEDVDATVRVRCALHPRDDGLLVGHVEVRSAVLARMSPPTTVAPSASKRALASAPCPRAVPLISATLPCRRPLTCLPSSPPRT